MLRTHYCGQIDETLLGKEVALCGWINRIRDLGGIAFIDLRDREGLVQVVIDPQDIELVIKARTLRNESVIRIAGKVRARPEGIVNKEIKSGKVEVLAQDLEIYNIAEPLPFQINERQEASEELRLKYRYLDLRRPEMMRNLVLRARIVACIRKFLDTKGFIETETPILTKSTPEGARDYLVPSRVHHGEFYALPQSPQIFKQLLMVAGMDRYYQIPRCFRDEDLRADRQPEFTQLDVEMSFIEAIDIQNLMEEMLRSLFTEILNVTLPNPFPRLTYQEAISRYGSDKPDLRIPLELVEIKDEVKNCEFKIFSEAARSPSHRVAVLRVPNGSSISRKQIDDYTALVAKYGLKGLATLKVNDVAAGLNGVQSSILKFLSDDIVIAILKKVNARNGDMLFFGAGKSKAVSDGIGALRLKVGRDCGLQAEVWRPLWVVDFPMFESQDGAWTSVHHPFTAPQNEDIASLKANPGATTAKAYDMVLNGSELGGGSIRICNAELQKTVFDILNIDEKTAYGQFGHLLDAFKYGYPRHGGIAFGIDRIVMLMVGAESLREVIPFPKTQTAQCPLTNAPSPVSEAQLRELGIAVLPKKEPTHQICK